MRGIDAHDEVAASVAATEATEMEPGGVRLGPDGLESTAAGEAGDRRDLARADGVWAGLVGGVVDGHGGSSARNFAVLGGSDQRQRRVESVAFRLQATQPNV
jgi:hypothetical protein